MLVVINVLENQLASNVWSYFVAYDVKLSRTTTVGNYRENSYLSQFRLF